MGALRVVDGWKEIPSWHNAKKNERLPKVLIILEQLAGQPLKEMSKECLETSELYSLKCTGCFTIKENHL